MNPTGHIHSFKMLSLHLPCRFSELETSTSPPSIPKVVAYFICGLQHPNQELRPPPFELTLLLSSLSKLIFPSLYILLPPYKKLSWSISATFLFLLLKPPPFFALSFLKLLFAWCFSSVCLWWYPPNKLRFLNPFLCPSEEWSFWCCDDDSLISVIKLLLVAFSRACLRIAPRSRDEPKLWNHGAGSIEVRGVVSGSSSSKSIGARRCTIFCWLYSVQWFVVSCDGYRILVKSSSILLFKWNSGVSCEEGRSFLWIYAFRRLKSNFSGEKYSSISFEAQFVNEKDTNCEGRSILFDPTSFLFFFQISCACYEVETRTKSS